jgi:hypothetical protein
MTRTVTLTATARDAAGHAAVSTTRLTVRTLVGMDAPNGQPYRDCVTQYPNLRYTREFGKDGPDTDSLPELPAMNATKFIDSPADAVLHVSWKDDVEQLASWLDGLTRPIYLSWFHEPMGDVTPATYRATAARVPQIIAAHPKRRMVLGNGPIVTRYWLDEGGGSPTDWGYPGMTHYGVDAYQDQPTAAAYWAPAKMFGVAFGKIRSAYPGIRLWVPEYGITRLNTDTTGAGRAQAIRDQVGWLKTQTDVDAVAYYNNAADFPKYAIDPTGPEGQAWRDMQAF